jgi:hypothetical protein
VRERVTSALRPFGRAEHVTAVGSPYRAPGRISADRHIAFATTNTHEDPNEARGAELEPGQPQSVAGLEPTAKEI